MDTFADTFQHIAQTLTIWALPVLLAITVHEAAHGYAARYFGDMTATRLGRVTLNPIPHIDPLGTIIVPLLLYISTSGTFLFGYARPVPVDWRNLRNPRRDMVWVALAGPASNFIQAVLWTLLLVLLAIFLPEERVLRQMAQAGVLANLVMWAFNLFPLPPLDGGRIAVGLLPQRLALPLARVEPWGFFIVLALVLAGIIGDVWLHPLIAAGQEALYWLARPIVWLLAAP